MYLSLKGIYYEREVPAQFHEIITFIRREVYFVGGGVSHFKSQHSKTLFSVLFLNKHIFGDGWFVNKWPGDFQFTNQSENAVGILQFN